MSEWSAPNPRFRERLLSNVAAPGFTSWAGTTVERLDPGIAHLSVRFRDDLAQHHGYFHGGVIGALGDNACGIAAGTLVDGDRYPITAEYTINIVRPANGDRLVARASVVKPGARLTTCAAEVSCCADGNETLVAVMLSTHAIVPG